MRLSGLLLFVLAAVVIAQDQEELQLAEPCDPETCKLPDCLCSSTSIPGGLAPRDTPQFVMVTFDDAVNVINFDTYRMALYNRWNTNGCPAGATFYVSHEYTNYQMVNELYNNGFEIALHSITHQTPPSYWAEATEQTFREEVGGQKSQMAHFANIPATEIHGVRIPFLQMAGNASFAVKKEFGLTYDCSWPTITFSNPGLWPYSLDYESIQDCVVPPCPTASIPGAWVVPMVSWRDLQGFPCSMADGCHFTPALNDEDGWFEFIVGNFERHYKGNRAPFGYFVHQWFLGNNQAVYRAFIRFLDMINNLPDVFMVNTKQVVDWVRNPVPINEYRNQACRFWQRTTCQPTSCGPLPNAHNPGGADYWMVGCTPCPRVYPWRGNPFGL